MAIGINANIKGIKMEKIFPINLINGVYFLLFNPND